jgi:hypothetical protein
MTFDLTILWESFYSKEGYRRVFHHWKGVGLWLIFLLSAVAVLILSVRMHVQIKGWTDEFGPQLAEQVPVVLFSDGTASTPEEQEYRIMEPESGELLAIIDTTREAAPADLDGAYLYLTSQTLTVKKNEVETRSYQVSEFGDYELTPEKSENYIRLAGNWLAPFCAPFIGFGVLLVRIIQWLFFSLLALAARNFMKVPGTYAQTLRLTIAAMTPALVVDIIRDLAGAQPPFFGFLFLGLIIFYLFFAVAALRVTTPEESPRWNGQA